MPEFDPVPEFDIAAVRKRFTALSGDFVFLDAPGGTQVPDEVGDRRPRLPEGERQHRRTLRHQRAHRGHRRGIPRGVGPVPGLRAR